MRRPRGQGLASKICDVLADAPRPMFLGEIEAALEFQYSAAEIMSVLVKLKRAKKVASERWERVGPGRRMANAYCLERMPMESG
ncbi:hypothetical protein [Chromobacterium haemolyticum]|uniref:hypothetical protein n=1 Tax=Chromobacterium haemolyticum TaxID=394935 RepID=UPI001315D4F8|nr:hypothetical protein [Chromobacterium haemolyticum]BBH12893.1 hypothetical protein CH06BL_21410 [Chromobacterium haemolyticum]